MALDQARISDLLWHGGLQELPVSYMNSPLIDILSINRPLWQHKLRITRILRTMHSMGTDDSVTVSAAEFHRNVGVYQDIALTKPVTITKNGRERTVLLSAQEYARLKRRDRRVVAAGELSERQVDAIRNARIPDRYADLDKEIKD